MDAREREEFVGRWGSVLLRSWADDDFKARLHADPKAVLRDAGLDIRGDATVTLGTAPDGSGPDLDHQIDLYARGHDSRSYLFYAQDPGVPMQEIVEWELEGGAIGACC